MKSLALLIVAFLFLMVVNFAICMLLQGPDIVRGLMKNPRHTLKEMKYTFWAINAVPILMLVVFLLSYLAK